MAMRINEKEFSTALNISRTPILSSNRIDQGTLVEHIPKIGIVKGISIKDALEIYDIRALDTWLPLRL